MSAEVVSFAEESCWDGEKFRTIRREIVFVLAGHAIQTGKMIRREFVADFGLWYDQEDDWLIGILQDLVPEIEWGWYVFHKKLDHSGIMIHNPETNQVVGSIFPRGRTKQKLSGENTAANVVPITLAGEYRARRLTRDAARAKKRSERHRPEDN